MGFTIAGFDTGINLPTFSSTNIGFWISVIALIILFIVVLGVIIWLYIMSKTYFIKIRDFENVAGQGFQLAGRNTARLFNIGDSGEEVLQLRKGGKFRTAYGRKMGKNEYWFAKGQDGYWYNCLLGDFDAKRGMLDIEPVDRDVRYMHVAIRKNIQDRYKVKDSMLKYAPLIISFIVLIIMLIGMWFLISKIGDLVTIASTNIKAGEPIAAKMTEIIGKMDSLCSGSGIRTSG